ncbi:MAG: winged helix-turn-helix domain-containing protein [Prevotella sp.]|nr:winged helix-turn-helix domain-containing protein [Prevotella sp.]
MLKKIIKQDARYISSLLSKRGKIAISELIGLTEYREEYIYMTLGWLSCENRIYFHETNEHVYIELANEK